MPAPRPPRSPRPQGAPKSGYGKQSDQGRGAAKRNQDTHSGRTQRPRDAEGFEQRGAPAAPARKGWGSLTRKGAAGIKERGQASSREAERAERPRDNNKDEWVAVRPEKKKRSAIEPERPRFDIPDDAIKEITERAGRGADRLLRYLKDAGTAYASDRYADARKALRPLLQETPDAPIVQELYGMVLYRQGRWAPAVKELRSAHMQTRSFDLYPALMDCHRALGQYRKTQELWDELRAESPSAEVMTEGRIVMAGALRDQSREQDAIRLMEKAPRPKANIKEHHLRTLYVLADLYDAVGETGKARSLFQKVAKHDPHMADVADRIEALG